MSFYPDVQLSAIPWSIIIWQGSLSSSQHSPHLSPSFLFFSYLYLSLYQYIYNFTYRYLFSLPFILHSRCLSTSVSYSHSNISFLLHAISTLYSLFRIRLRPSSLLLKGNPQSSDFILISLWCKIERIEAINKEFGLMQGKHFKVSANEGG